MKYEGVTPWGQTHNFEVCGLLCHRELFVWDCRSSLIGSRLGGPIIHINRQNNVLFRQNGAINTLVKRSVPCAAETFTALKVTVDIHTRFGYFTCALIALSVDHVCKPINFSVAFFFPSDFCYLLIL